MNRLVIATLIALLAVLSLSSMGKAELDKRRYIPIDIMILQDLPVSKQAGKPIYGQRFQSAGVTQMNEDRLMCLKADIRRQVKHRWLREKTPRVPICVAFTLWDTGLVTDMKVTRTSHNATQDRAAIIAVADASPFKYPPTVPVKVQVEFDERMNSGLASSLDAVHVSN